MRESPPAVRPGASFCVHAGVRSLNGQRRGNCGFPSFGNFPELSTRRWENPGAALCSGPGVRLFGASPGGSCLRSRLMRGTYLSSRAFPCPQFPSSVSPSGCHLLPAGHELSVSGIAANGQPTTRGRLKTNFQLKTRQRPSGARRTTCRTDAPVLIPLLRAVDLLLKREPASRLAPKDFSLGVWGMFLFLRKRNIPQKAAPQRCNHPHSPFPP